MNCCFGSIYPQDVGTDREFRVSVGDVETSRYVDGDLHIGLDATLGVGRPPKRVWGVVEDPRGYT